MQDEGVDVEDRYYSRDEFMALSKAQKSKLIALREARGHFGRKKRKKMGDEKAKGTKPVDEDTVKKLFQKQEKKFSRKLAAVSEKMGSVDLTDDAEEEEASDAGPNRTNAALARQKGPLRRKK